MNKIISTKITQKDMLYKKKNPKLKAFLPGEYFFFEKNPNNKKQTNKKQQPPTQFYYQLISHTWIAFHFIKSYRRKYISMTELLCYHHDICIQEYKDLLRWHAQLWLQGSQSHSEDFWIYNLQTYMKNKCSRFQNGWYSEILRKILDM